MMLRHLFLAGTGLFWLTVAGVALVALGVLRGPPASEPPAGAPPGAAARVTLQDLADHAQAGDCWLAIDGEVYDVSAYVERHPAEPEVLLAWCGREASEAYHTKLRGRDHSERADAMLPNYRVGTLQAAGGR